MESLFEDAVLLGEAADRHRVTKRLADKRAGRPLHNEWALSVACLAEATVDEVALAASKEIAGFDGYKGIRSTTVGDLRRAGYNVVPDRLPHALVMLPSPPMTDDFVRIEGTLSPKVPNPGYKRKT